jgi:hypothetical protein
VTIQGTGTGAHGLRRANETEAATAKNRGNRRQDRQRELRDPLSGSRQHAEMRYVVASGVSRLASAE